MNNLALTTINAATIAQEKTHTAGDGMGFIALLANYRPADTNQLATNTTFLNLNYLFDSDKLRYINDNIIVNGEEQPTANSVGVVLYNPQGEPSNLAIYPLNESEPFLLHPFNNDGFIIGTGGELVAMPSIDSLAEIYIHTSEEQKYTFLVPFQSYQFDSLVKGYAKHTQVTLFTMLANVPALSKTFKTDNIKLVGTVDTIEDILMEYSIDEILALPDTQIMTLGGLDWGTPEPLEDDNTPATRYPIEAWIGVLGDAVRAIAHHAQVPEAMAGQCVLGALATMLQQYINATFADGEPMPVSLFLLTRGASTDGKNRTVRFSHKVIKDHQKNLDDKHREDLEIWQADKRATPRKELDNFLLNNPQPVQKTLFVSSGTLQGIIGEMLNNQQKSMAWVTSDAGQFFGGYSMDDKNGNKTIADLSDVWSEGYFDNVTKGNMGNKRAYDLRFTLDLQGQDEIIRIPLADPIMNGQGFLPRFLFAFPDSMRGKRVYNTPERINDNSEHDPRLQAYWQACRALLDPLPSTKQTDDKGNPIKINMTFADQHARQALADYQQYCENAIGKGGRLEKYPAYAGRQAENASRIASLMAYFEGRTALTVDDIKRASLLTEYSISERLRYDGESMGGDSAGNDSQKLVNWLIAKAKAKDTNVLNKSYVSQNAPTSLRGKKLEYLLSGLESLGYVRLEQVERKKLVYINPYLL